jgi:hypothetical protein
MVFFICSRPVPLTPSPPAPTCQPALFFSHTHRSIIATVHTQKLCSGNLLISYLEIFTELAADPLSSPHSELAREKMWSRIYLTPLLQAEEDRDQARRYFADQAREMTLLGTQSSAYNSDR